MSDHRVTPDRAAKVTVEIPDALGSHCISYPLSPEEARSVQGYIVERIWGMPAITKPKAAS